MSWLDNPFRNTEKETADLSYPPSGGWVKITVLGLLIPLWITFHAYQAWTTEQALWIGRRANEVITGEAAKWMAGTYLGVALFCFSRWCLGIVFSHRAFEIGTIISILLFLVGLGGAFLMAMA